jgi:hypothetical protein
LPTRVPSTVRTPSATRTSRDRFVAQRPALVEGDRQAGVDKGVAGAVGQREDVQVPVRTLRAGDDRRRAGREAQAAVRGRKSTGRNCVAVRGRAERPAGSGTSRCTWRVRRWDDALPHGIARREQRRAASWCHKIVTWFGAVSGPAWGGGRRRRRRRRGCQRGRGCDRRRRRRGGGRRRRRRRGRGRRGGGCRARARRRGRARARGRRRARRRLGLAVGLAVALGSRSSSGSPRARPSGSGRRPPRPHERAVRRPTSSASAHRP